MFSQHVLPRRTHGESRTDDDSHAKLQTTALKAAALSLFGIDRSKHQPRQSLLTRSVAGKNPCNMLLPSFISQYIHCIQSLSRKWSTHALSQQNDSPRSLSHRMNDVFLRTWDLGLTAFGGPPVHFQILHRRFVEGKEGREQWVDEQTVL